MMPKSHATAKEPAPQLGRRSLEMMFGTATIQTNSTMSMRPIWRRSSMAACWSPVVAACSPIALPNERQVAAGTLRDLDHDVQRPPLHWMLILTTYHQYAEWAAAQRMLFLYRDGAYIPAPNELSRARPQRSVRAAIGCNTSGAPRHA